MRRADLEEDNEGVLALWPPGSSPDIGHGEWLRATFGDRAWLAVELHRGPDDARRLHELRELGRRLGLRLVASGDVHMHARGRRALQDTVAAIRHRTTVAEAGDRLFPNGERHLRRREALAQIHPPELLAETQAIADRCRFEMDQLKYTYPKEVVPEGHTPTTWLRALVEQRLPTRWPRKIPDGIREKIEKELALIASWRYSAKLIVLKKLLIILHLKPWLVCDLF